MKEQQIRKQFRDAVRIQTRQYKALQQQLLLQVPKTEQRELIQRLKEEQKRKLALLSEQYEANIATMIEGQTVCLSSLSLSPNVQYFTVHFCCR